MRHFITGILMAFAATVAAADPDYRTLHMEIDIDRPAAAVWAKVGGYCDIAKWFNNLDCRIVAGDGGVGTVRELRHGTIVEILVGKTDLSYGYTQPAKAGSFYNLYHGFMEAKPVSPRTSKIVYTLIYDVADKPDESAKQADLTKRRALFEAGLRRMKEIAEQ